LTAGLLDFCDQRAEFGLTPPARDDLGTFLGEQLGRCMADARTCAGDAVMPGLGISRASSIGSRPEYGAVIQPA